MLTPQAQQQLAIDVKASGTLNIYYWLRKLYRGFIMPYRWVFGIAFIIALIVVMFNVQGIIYAVTNDLWIGIACAGIPVGFALAINHMMAGSVLNKLAEKYGTDQQTIDAAADNILNGVS